MNKVFEFYLQLGSEQNVSVLLHEKEEFCLRAEAGEEKCNGQTVISIRRARLSDYPAIEVFIKEAYGKLAPFKLGERWAWQFSNNPYMTVHDGSVPVWIAESSGKVVGQIAVQEGEIQIDGMKRPAGWVVDVMILPSYRKLGLGHQLFAAVARENPILVTLTMASATRRMAERLNAVELAKVSLYSRFSRLDPQTIRRYMQVRCTYHPRLARICHLLCRYFFAHYILTIIGNLSLSIRDALIRLPRSRSKTQIVEVQYFEREIDLLWQKVSKDFPVAFARRSKFLNWRFCECPQMNYRCFTAIRDGQLVGYLVLRRSERLELPQGMIVDLLAARQDRETVEDLIAFAVGWFGESVASVECATSISEFVDVLRSFGFHTARTERPNAVVADKEVRERLKASSGQWLLSKADHDWDQIRLA